jgi:hypothetical protein
MRQRTCGESTLNPQAGLRLEGVQKAAKKILVRELGQLHSFHVCHIISQIEALTLALQEEKAQVLE